MTNEDPTTDPSVAARVKTGLTGLARGAEVTAANLPADTVINTVKAVKGTLDLASKSLTDLVAGVDGIGDAELQNVQVYLDQAQAHLNGILHTAKQSQEQAKSTASQR